MGGFLCVEIIDCPISLFFLLFLVTHDALRIHIFIMALLERALLHLSTFLSSLHFTRFRSQSQNRFPLLSVCANKYYTIKCGLFRACHSSRPLASDFPSMKSKSFSFYSSRCYFCVCICCCCCCCCCCFRCWHKDKKYWCHHRSGVSSGWNAVANRCPCCTATTTSIFPSSCLVIIVVIFCCCFEDREREASAADGGAGGLISGCCCCCCCCW